MFSQSSRISRGSRGSKNGIFSFGEVEGEKEQTDMGKCEESVSKICLKVPTKF
jgi:hypothetical protein